MSVTYNQLGNLIRHAEEGDLDVLAHGIGCFHTTGLDISKGIFAKYPLLKSVDKKTPFGDVFKVGSISTCSIGDLDLFNLYVKYGDRATDPRSMLLREGHENTVDQNVPHLDYWALEQSLLAMLERLQLKCMSEKRCYRIGMPMIGKEAGGLPLKITRIIDRTIGFMDVTIYI